MDMEDVYKEALSKEMNSINYPSLSYIEEVYNDKPKNFAMGRYEKEYHIRNIKARRNEIKWDFKEIGNYIKLGKIIRFVKKVKLIKLGSDKE